MLRECSMGATGSEESNTREFSVSNFRLCLVTLLKILTFTILQDDLKQDVQTKSKVFKHRFEALF